VDGSARLCGCLGINRIGRADKPGKVFVPRLSILIPVLGSVGDLETTLVSVLENRPADCEIIVLLAAPYEDPYALEGEVRFVTVSAANDLVATLNRGIEESRGEVVHFLMPGQEVNDGWADFALRHFQDPRIASVAPVLVDSRDQQSVVAAGVQYSARYGRVVYQPQCVNEDVLAVEDQKALAKLAGPLIDAAFYRRIALQMAGGLSSAVGDDLADVDLGLVLRSAGYLTALEPHSRVLSTPAVVRSAKPGFRSALRAETLFWRAAAVVGWWKSLAAHPIGVVSEFVTCLPHPRAFTALLGRICGACRLHQHGMHVRWLNDMQRTAEAMLHATRKEHRRFDAGHVHQSLAAPEMAAERVGS
jgi:hypothetical protein